MQKRTDASTGASVPLTELRDGQSGIVVQLNGGCGFQEHMVAMGIRVGAKIRIVRGSRNGPVLVATGDARFAIGNGMAEKVVILRTKGEGG